MINGEEEPSRVVVDFSDRLLLEKESGRDVSPGSSLHYSSCGESEFERYCSANSALGTPSMCSSTGPFQDSLESEFENFSLGPSLIKFSSLDSTRGIQFSDEGGSCNGISSIAPGLNPLKVNTQETGYSEDMSGELMDSEATIEKDSMNRLAEMDDKEVMCRSDSQFHTSGIDREDGSSIDDEHSDGDDSLSDASDHSGKYVPGNVQYIKEPKDENDNPFLINSSTAFGTNDWDEFELEATELVDTPFDFSGFEKHGEACTGNEGTSTKSLSVALRKLPVVAQAGKGEEHTNVTASTRHAPDVGDFCENIGDVVRSRDLTVSTQREQGDVGKDSITARGFGDLSAKDRTLVVPQSLVTDGSLRDTWLSNNQTEDTPVVMNYLQSCSADEDFLDTTPVELGNEESSGGVDLDANELLHESSENGKQLDPFGECTSEPLLVSRNSDKPSSSDSNPVPNVLQVTYTQPKKENTELNDFYDDFVHDMEEILLDSGESSGARFSKNDKMFQLQLSLPNRDGGQTATTSGLDDSSPTVSQRFRIDRVEVVGVKQKKGDVSLSERLVGVKEYTVYVITVWSGKDKWEIERRYRDFYSLYRRLTSLFADQGWTLPTPWASVEKESRKIFGTSPNAVAERTVLLQDCLNSVLQSRFFPTLPNALLRFLSPQDACANSSGSGSIVSPTISPGITATATSSFSYGNTISFIVDVRPHKSVKQLLEAQHYICAGCHRYFDDGATLVRDFVKALGWGKPRLCEYTGQLFCSSCHTHDMAVMPATVLHHWDFNRYPVSQLAKSYLDSIHEQPMLCVSAVNPFLSSKVPALNHIMSVRKRITMMLPYIRCPFRKTLNKGLSSRRYLLESTDFFALRDLVDLSKGPFAALPAIVETVRKKIVEHITEQCLVCCDVGVPCNARQACDDTSSLIFPFQSGLRYLSDVLIQHIMNAMIRRKMRLTNAGHAAQFSTRDA
ncbi:PREDICTED: uncharacterized protein LOC104791032 isoform X2 [Camelina sativa]|uniref:Uncharacterized protein LOC104791032 isoform X2 n=1 Tax=Camelina sativa TaxID=90675 RepID=A0ABM0ZFT0_CAMSA|nr:PREDICTED: uncharacterized protein LOC104791032 isoform X2 [Camelina sativa]